MFTGIFGAVLLNVWRNKNYKAEYFF